MKKMLRKILAVLVVFSVVLSVGIIAMQGVPWPTTAFIIKTTLVAR